MPSIATAPVDTATQLNTLELYTRLVLLRYFTCDRFLVSDLNGFAVERLCAPHGELIGAFPLAIREDFDNLREGTELVDR